MQGRAISITNFNSSSKDQFFRESSFEGEGKKSTFAFMAGVQDWSVCWTWTLKFETSPFFREDTKKQLYTCIRSILDQIRGSEKEVLLHETWNATLEQGMTVGDNTGSGMAVSFRGRDTFGKRAKAGYHVSWKWTQCRPENTSHCWAGYHMKINLRRKETRQWEFWGNNLSFVQNVPVENCPRVASPFFIGTGAKFGSGSMLAHLPDNTKGSNCESILQANCWTILLEHCMFLMRKCFFRGTRNASGLFSQLPVCSLLKQTSLNNRAKSIVWIGLWCQCFSWVWIRNQCTAKQHQ